MFMLCGSLSWFLFLVLQTAPEITVSSPVWPLIMKWSVASDHGPAPGGSSHQMVARRSLDLLPNGQSCLMERGEHGK